MSTGLENLEIYKLAERLEIYVYKLTEVFSFNMRNTTNQLRRSSEGVTNNIAESYGRYTFPDKIYKIHIARGEAEETRIGIIKCWKKGLLPKEVSDTVNVKYSELIKMINGYIKFLRKQQDNAKKKKTN